MSIESAPDLFSRLSDLVVCSILSKLPIRQAVRCSVLSHRWRFLYTQMPQLTISLPLLLSDNDDEEFFDYDSVDSLVNAKVQNIISNILLMHSSDLETFHLRLGKWDYYAEREFSCQNVWKWVRIVAQKNVQHLTLSHFVWTSDVYPPPAIFSCTALRTLTLEKYALSLHPTHFRGFNHLTTCIFFQIDVTDDSLALFISHCPLLKTLELEDCFGLRKPIISSPNIAHLCVITCYSDELEGLKTLTVNCQNLLTMKTCSHIKDLRVNGVLFYELSNAIVQLKMECGSNFIGLEFRRDWGIYDFPAERFVEIIGSIKSLKNLDIHIPKPLPLLNLLEQLPNLERLQIYKMFCSGLERDAIPGLERDAIPVCLGYPLANLRVLKVAMMGYDGREIPVCGCLLQSSPVLETIEIQIPKYEMESEKRFTKLLAKLLDLRRASSGAKIRVKRSRCKVEY